MKILCSNSIWNVRTRFNEFLRTPKTVPLGKPITITGFLQKLVYLLGNSTFSLASRALLQFNRSEPTYLHTVQILQTDLHTFP